MLGEQPRESYVFPQLSALLRGGFQPGKSWQSMKRTWYLCVQARRNETSVMGKISFHSGRAWAGLNRRLVSSGGCMENQFPVLCRDS